MKRKKREEYIENDDQMSHILIELGCEDVRLFRLKDKKEFNGQPLVSVLESLQELEKLVDTIERRGIKFEDYLAARDEKTGDLPSYAMRIKEDGQTRFEFACNDKEWSKLCDKYDVSLDEEAATEVKNGDNPKARQVKPLTLTESNSIQSAIETLEKKGFNIDHYADAGKPALRARRRGCDESVEGEVRGGLATPVGAPAEPPAKGEKTEKAKPKAKPIERRTPIHSIPQILKQIKDIGNRGIVIQRLQRFGRNESRGALGHDDGPRASQDAQGRADGRRRRRPHVHDPDGRRSRAAPPVHRGKRSQRPQPRCVTAEATANERTFAQMGGSGSLHCGSGIPAATGLYAMTATETQSLIDWRLEQAAESLDRGAIADRLRAAPRHDGLDLPLHVLLHVRAAGSERFQRPGPGRRAAPSSNENSSSPVCCQGNLATASASRRKSSGGSISGRKSPPRLSASRNSWRTRAVSSPQQNCSWGNNEPATQNYRKTGAQWLGGGGTDGSGLLAIGRRRGPVQPRHGK